MFGNKETKNSSPEGKENQYSKKALENKLKELKSGGLPIEDQTIAKVNFLSEKGRFFGASQVEKAMKDIEKMTRSFLKGKLDNDEKAELAQDIKDKIDERGGRIANMKESIDNTKNEVIDSASQKWESVKQNVGDAYDVTKGAIETGGRYVADKTTELKDGVVDTARDVKKTVVETASELKDGVVDTATAVKETVQGKYENTKENIGDFVSGVRTGYRNDIADSEVMPSNAEVKGEKIGVMFRDAKDGVVSAGEFVRDKTVAAKETVKSGVETAIGATIYAGIEGARLVEKGGKYIFENLKQGVESTRQFMTETVPLKAKEIKDTATEKVTEVKKSALEKKQSWVSKLISKLQSSNDKTAGKLQAIESRANEKKEKGDLAATQADMIERAIAA